MRLHDLLQHITCQGKLPANGEVAFITEDSRKVRPGSVFCCVPGAKVDGHDFAAQAVKNGAVCIVAQKPTGTNCEVIVENTRAAYALLCAAYHGHPAKQLTLVGVTGTNGKTTTTYILKQLFDNIGYNTGLVGTMVNMVKQEQYPSVLTTPDPWELQGLFVKMVEEGCTHCFMEVSSQALDQRRVEGIVFRLGVFSNLTQDHLDYHGTFENYLLAKRRLFLQSKVGIVNLDDDAAPRMVEGTPARPVTYSIRRNDADYTAKQVQLGPGSVGYELVCNGAIGRVRYGVPGEFSVYNTMAAACAALELGVEMQDVVRGLAAAGGVRGRMEVVPNTGDFTVIIDYAHTPDALENILRTVNEINSNGGRIITVFGAAGERDATKRPVMGEIAAQHSDIIVITSDNPRGEDEMAIIEQVRSGVKRKIKVYIEPDRKQAIALALKRAKADDIILLAGKGHEDYQALSTGDIAFDEREIVKEILEG